MSSSSVLRRSFKISSSIISRYQSISTLFLSQSQSDSVPQFTNFSTLNNKPQNDASGFEFPSGFSSRWNFSSGFSSRFNNNRLVFFSTQAASTSDGLTVDDIVDNQWTILDESECDWKSHASAIAQSIGLIKKRLQVMCLICRNCYFDPHFSELITM